MSLKNRYIQYPQMVIYQILNTANGKSYIGQATRGWRYRYQSTNWWNSVTNIHLKNSIKKYGHQKFKIITLESNVKSEEELDRLERYYIKKLNAMYPNGYNYHEGGQIEKLHGHSDASIAKIVKSKGHGTMKLLNNITQEIHEFENMSKFARENGLCISQLCQVINGKRRVHKGWTLPNKPLERLKFISPKGEEFIVIRHIDGGVKGFCKKHDFVSTGHVFSTINGQYSQASGWKIEKI